MFKGLICFVAAGNLQLKNVSRKYFLKHIILQPADHPFARDKPATNYL